LKFFLWLFENGFLISFSASDMLFISEEKQDE